MTGPLHPRLWLAAVLVSVLIPNLTYAGIIGLADFGPSAVVVDYNDTLLAGGAFGTPTPLTIHGDIYTGGNGPLGYPILGTADFTFGGPQGPFNGYSLFNNEFIDIVFDSPVLRAGGNVGEFLPWSASVSFFDESDMLLGAVNLSGSNYATGGFAGWEADSGLIGRMRITSTSASNGALMVFDNLTKEAAPVAAVPEPTMLATWILGTISVLGRRLFFRQSRR